MAWNGVAQIPDAVLDVLACPVCGAGVDLGERTLRCASGHSFDLARQGYVNLRTGHRPSGTADTAAMVAARADFLAAGHYTSIATAVARCVADRPPGRENGPGERRIPAETAQAPGPPDVILEVGAGTGYYLTAVLDALPHAYGVAIDVSTHALRRAARVHPRATAVGADVWRQLPLRDSSVAALLDVFAPRNAAEFHRVLRPDGALVVVTPTTEHLAELVGTLEMLVVDERKDERLEETLASRFALESRWELTIPLSLEAGDVDRLVQMGPTAHHVDEAALREQVAGLVAPRTRFDVTASVIVSGYRPSW